MKKRQQAAALQTLYYLGDILAEAVSEVKGFLKAPAWSAVDGAFPDLRAIHFTQKEKQERLVIVLEEIGQWGTGTPRMGKSIGTAYCSLLTDGTEGDLYQGAGISHFTTMRQLRAALGGEFC